MDTPEKLPLSPAPPSRLMTRRNLFRLAGAGAFLGLTAEAARIVFGSNEHTVIPGKVYRSAQLTTQKLGQVIAEKHIRTVINLRGCCPNMGWYLNDARATFAAGISQEDLTFSAKRYPHPGELARLIDVLDHTEYPIIFHCARGADRTGVASTITKLLLTNSSVSEARRQLLPRYGHVGAIGRTGVLDEFFDAYEAKLEAGGEAHSPDRFRNWVKNEYCPGPFRAALAILAPTPLTVPANAGFTITIRATNLSPEPWHLTPGGRGVRLGYFLLNPTGGFAHRGQAGLLARIVQPGESVEMVAGFPPLAKGTYIFHADMIDAQPIEMLDSGFAQYGSTAIDLGLTVA